MELVKKVSVLWNHVRVHGSGGKTPRDLNLDNRWKWVVGCTPPRSSFPICQRYREVAFHDKRNSIVQRTRDCPLFSSCLLRKYITI